MNIRVLLVAAMVVGLVASLVTIGSQAFFGDTETSSGNVAEAGVMDIQVDDQDDPLGALVTYTGTNDIKPSRDLEPVVARITNTGQNPGHLDLHYKNVVVSGGILSEPECTSQGGIFMTAPAVEDCQFLVQAGPGTPVPPPTILPTLPDGNPIVGQPACIGLGGAFFPAGAPIPPAFPSGVTVDVCVFFHSITTFAFDVTNINDFFEVDVHDVVSGVTTETGCLDLTVPGTWYSPPNVCGENPAIVAPTPLGPFIPGAGGGIESLCIELGEISVDESRDILLTFHLHESAGNEYQGDTVTFDIEFTLHEPGDPSAHSDTPGTQCETNDPLPSSPLANPTPSFVRTVAPGDLVISEIMFDPTAVADADGEWFEIFNTRSDVVVVLAGWVIRDSGGDSHTLAPANFLFVPPLGRVVLARNAAPAANGGVPVDYQYGAGMTLDNGADEIELVDPVATVVDVVAYASGTWPMVSGASLNLDPALHDAVFNDAPASWCEATLPYLSGDLGTPRVANSPCFP